MIKVKLNSSEMGVAWMLKYDGTAIPVTVHVYGAIGDLDANLEAALWMYNYNHYDKLDDFIRDYVCYLALNEVPYTTDREQFTAALINVLKSLPFNPGKMIGANKETIAQELYDFVDGMDIDEIYDRGETVNDNTGDFVAKDLNETFIRVRMNDEYNASSYNGVGYFRIGSTYKDWTNPIYMFVADNPKIKTIVVERDAESDGEEGSGQRRVMINNMSREEFLSAERLPFLGSRNVTGINGTMYKLLANMNSKYSDIFNIRANAERLDTIYNKLRFENLNSNYKRITAPWATKPMNR